jgi:hypothetical protein
VPGLAEGDSAADFWFCAAGEDSPEGFCEDAAHTPRAKSHPRQTVRSPNLVFR